MALGNSSGKSTARHKGQTKLAIKERKIAGSFVQFSHGARQPSGSDACSVSSMDEKGWTDNTSNGFAIGTNDYFYTKQRANPNFYTAPGFYKVGPNVKGNFYHIEIGQNGQVISTPGGSTQCP
jgi:hypothetical protein